MAVKIDPSWGYIEMEGAIFRGPSRNIPRVVWRGKTGTWEEYPKDAQMNRPYEWGYSISEEEAKEWMAEIRASYT